MRHGVLCCWACMLLACTLGTAGSRATNDGGLRSSSNGSAEASALDNAGRVLPPFAPNSARAVPTVAIIGTAKAGTTDLYSLITKISRQAPGGKRECRRARCAFAPVVCQALRV